jgi:hypothetical protein
MDDLPPWAFWIMTMPVRLSPGLAILSVPMIARLTHRVASPRREVSPKLSREASHGEPAAASVPRW